MNQKRNPDDAAATQRRLSTSEQQAPSGFLSGMWTNWTKGK